ncbi:LytR/AlgR family response regulator transcription factor [Pseudoalteromonas sp. SSDWG2]|uniref:LytR/AlgR family response regulator transcription factor n=1 Tax=Pseudoalteromonas sp. SSDWG2 TaxID=3139391 RepID=UPI003BA8E977
MLRALIVDDEPLARARLKRLLSAHEATVCVLAEAADGKEALAQFKALQVDVVFLDIEMPELSGVEVAKVLANEPHPPAIVFTTAYSEHALTAVNLQAVGYLLKPVEAEHLAHILSKLGTTNRAQNSERQDETISYQLGNKIIKVALEDVCYFHADGKYTQVMTVQGAQGLVDEPLKALEERFGMRFVRVHRNCLVNSGEIAALEAHEQGHVIRLKSNKQPISVSRRALKQVKSLL